MKFLQADYIWALLFTHVRCIKLSILLFSPCSAKTRKKEKKFAKKVGKSNSFNTFLKLIFSKRTKDFEKTILNLA